MRRAIGAVLRLLPFKESPGKRGLSLAVVFSLIVGVTAVAVFAIPRQPDEPSTRSSTVADSNGDSRPKTSTPSIPAARSSGGSSRSNASKQGSAPATPSTTGTPAPFPTSFAVSARIGSECVRPGQRQSITIITRPNIAVAYLAHYADDRSPFDKGYYGGNNGGSTNDSGEWTDSWIVAPGAPAGPVRVEVIAQASDGRGYTTTSFAVADASGKCSS